MKIGPAFQAHMLKAQNLLDADGDEVTTLQALHASAEGSRMVVIKRVYEPYAVSDGYRVLVDRLWPRGLSKAKAHVDAWEKDIAPSSQLRSWFGHDPAKWPEFQKRYRARVDSAASGEGWCSRPWYSVPRLVVSHSCIHRGLVILVMPPVLIAVAEQTWEARK